MGPPLCTISLVELHTAPAVELPSSFASFVMSHVWRGESRDLILFTSTAIPAPTLNASPWQQPRVLAMVEGQMCDDYVCMSCCKVDLYQTDETFQIINTSDLEREKVAFQMFEHQNLKVFIWYLQAYL